MLTSSIWAQAPATWTTKASMTHERSGHTATTLGSGKALIVGGTDASGHPQSVAELYDPATGSFSILSSNLPTPVSGQTPSKFRR